MAIHKLFRAVLAGAVLAALPAQTFGQEAGIKAGFNSASLTPEEDEDPDTSRRIGFAGGGWVRMPVTPRFSFHVEGLFSEKGVKFNIPALPEFGGGEIELRLRYLEIPLLARGDFADTGSTTRFVIVGGVAPAFKLAARGRAESAGEVDTQDLDDEVHGFDLGLVGGGGIEFGRFMVEARYTHGITHINTDDNGDEDRIKNRVFSVMFGVSFR
jgi:hypothetical protein